MMRDSDAELAAEPRLVVEIVCARRRHLSAVDGV